MKTLIHYRNFVKNNNTLLRGDNTKSLYNGQCKSTILKQGEFILIVIGNATNVMDI